MAGSTTIPVYLLAGGKSSRMGQEKGLTLFQGIPMIRHLIGSTAPVASQQVIVGHHPGYHALGIPVIPDLIPDCGPLGGIYSALSHCQASHALILSCDSPLIQTDTMKKLLSHEWEGIVIGEVSGRLCPFPGIYPTSLLPLLRSGLERGEFKVQRFIGGQAHQVIDLATISAHPQHEFANFNTPEEVRAFSDLTQGI